MTSRTFALADVLTVATGFMVSPRGIEAVYDLCNYMTGDNLFTHQLPRAIRECAPEIYRQHPDLRAIAVPDFSAIREDHVEAWVREWVYRQVIKFGETREIDPLAAEGHTVINPLDELAMNRPNTTVIVVDTGEGGAR